MRKDYTRYSKETASAGAVEVVENVQQELEEVEPVKTVVGVVTDCIKLNVRVEPNAKAEVVCEIAASTELMIDEDRSTDEFYKIYTAAGIEGYCMKKFISIVP